MIQNNYKYFISIVIITIFLIISYTGSSFYFSTVYSLIGKKLIINLNETICNPIKVNSKQFSVILNGESYPKSITLTRNKSIDFKCLNKYKTKFILFWNSFFRDEKLNFGLGKSKPFLDNRCPVINCETTTDQSKINQSHIVITHMRNPIHKAPKYRPPGQKWIFFLLESPLNVASFNNLNNFYNLTYTYKLESSFPGAYEMISGMYWTLNENFNENFDFYAEKTDFSAAVISNCAQTSPRIGYINQLRYYIKVDLFGKCGKKCPSFFKNSKIKGDCKEIIGKSYKFYFAFENSICDGYLTEKFFYILRYNIIPVVMGGGPYEHYIPKSGFVNVFDYKSPKELANYLLYLDKNKKAYNSYFKWKKYVRFDNLEYPIHPICDICIQLQLDEYFGTKISRAKNLDEYSNKKNCKNFKIGF